jgi:hypothetical protein
VLAGDGDTESRSAITPSRPAQHSVATIPDRGGDLENIASIVIDRPTNP